MSFGDRVSATAGIRAILDGYPFSVGLLREFVQNSDDAGASKQTFLLDRRNHPAEQLCDPRISGTQGPALLAYNDAEVSEDDWIHLQSIHESSKSADSTKIGKYGQGFRSCYHITDNPQILSGRSLAIFDPHRDGHKVDFIKSSQKCADHLKAFDSFLLAGDRRKAFKGTVFRLPLRTNSDSKISSNTPSPDQIQTLLHEFIKEELAVILLFLQHVSEIDLYEINGQGKRVFLASAMRDNTPVERLNEIHSTLKCVVNVKIGSQSSEETWRIWHSVFEKSLVSEHLGNDFDVDAMLSKHKLRPGVSLAVPISTLSARARWKGGRIFTFLPLPLATGFPFHVHGLFALTQSRQNLRNNGEKGLVAGSDDQFLVDWNAHLFNVILPRALSTLFPVLVQRDALADIFRAWPTQQPEVKCGDSSNWSALLWSLLDHVVFSKAPVWPLWRTGKLVDLGSVLVAADSENILDVLVEAGLSIVVIPAHICAMLRESYSQVSFLNPQTVHRELRPYTKKLLRLSSTHKEQLLEYLLSSDDLQCIIGIPLIQTVAKEWVALVSRQAAEHQGNHTLLEIEDTGLFEVSDQRMIRLDLLSQSTAKLLREDGPGLLNVEILTAARVTHYIKRMGTFSEPTLPDDEDVQWLAKFWCWLHARTFEDDLDLSELWLLPTTSSLRKVEEGIFTTKRVKPSLVATLSTLSVPFLHPDFPATAENALKGTAPIYTIDDVHELANVIEATRMTPTGASELLMHLIRHTPLSWERHGQFTEIQRQALCRLKVFPLISPSNIPRPKTRNIKRSTSSLEYEGVKMIYVVAESLEMTLLPDADGIRYIHGLPDASLLLQRLGFPVLRLTQPVEVLQLALKHFQALSQPLQQAFVTYMAGHTQDVPRALVDTLSSIAFVPISSDNDCLRKPPGVVDPGSPIARLYPGGEDTLYAVPSPKDAGGKALIRDLRHLALMRRELSVDIVQERIQWVSRNCASNLESARAVAIELLKQLKNTKLDCSKLEIDNDMKWLPTKDGRLDSAANCRDDTRRQKKEHFDGVLEVLSPDIQVSSSLRTALGWDNPVSISVLIKQLGHLLEREGAYDALDSIISEISSRLLDEADLGALRQTVADKPWIPTLEAGILCRASRAVIFRSGSRTILPGFYQIRASGQHKSFLENMGVKAKPATEDLLSELCAQRDSEESQAVIVQNVIVLLEHLPPTLNPDERAQVLVPTTDGQLHPLPDVFYNDAGADASGSDDGTLIAHSSISGNLAVHLGMSFLRASVLQDFGSREMLGESLTTRIRGILQNQYTDQQMLTEFLANASDAGATKFSILVDERPGSTANLLAATMEPFQTCAALLLHNDGLFTTEDWDGICDVGLGGKKGRSDTIGHFGLGSLSMWHFSEIAMIVSGDRVMFLDPARQHLPPQYRLKSYCLLSLTELQRLYAGHLEPLDGLFGFRVKSTKYYRGTIFRLPLRTKEHYGKDPILRRTFNTRRIQRDISDAYYDQARNSLLFTSMVEISSHFRDVGGGDSQQQWAVSISREKPEIHGNGDILRTSTVHSIKDITRHTQSWKIATGTRDIPQEFSELAEKTHLRSSVLVGLAAPLDSISDATPSLFFSVLPLSIPTAFPVHISASFLLAPDRRTIRLDQADQAAYNRWLLSDVIPPFYLFLLQNLLKADRENTDRWWPACDNGLSAADTQDPTSVLVASLYTKHLPSTKHRVFRSLYHPQRYLVPKDAVVSRDEPPSVSHVLGKSEPQEIVKLPAWVPWLQMKTAGLRPIDPSYVREVLSRNHVSVASLFETVREYQDFVQFLEQEAGVQGLIGLHLLPLSDGTWTVFDTVDSGKLYYPWAPLSDGDLVFCKDDIIDSGYFPEDSEFTNSILGAGLNVARLTSDAAASLIRRRIGGVEGQHAGNESFQRWVDAFWRAYSRLPEGTEIGNFPLVPTSRSRHYISLHSCMSDKRVVVIHTSQGLPEWLCECLDTMGAIVVRRDIFAGTPLYRALEVEPKDVPSSAILNIMPFFSFLLSTSTLTSAFKRLEDKPHEKLATWIQECMPRLPISPPELRHLPIWRQINPDHAEEFVSAEDIHLMLPAAIPGEIVKEYMTVPFVEFSRLLERLGTYSVNPEIFCENLVMPSIITRPGQRRSYRPLMRKMLTMPLNEIRVPNGKAVVVASSTLYSREPLFTAAFDQEKFIHVDFMDMENELRSFGLKTWNSPATVDTVAMTMFKDCAINVVRGRHASTDNAGVVFKAYSEDLPVRISAPEARLWSEVNDIKFVPRDKKRRRARNPEEEIPDSSGYAIDLPDLVSPNQVLAEVGDAQIGVSNLQSVAWTQRALLKVPLDPRLLAANAEFGKPSADEVIDHLRVLTRIANDHPRNMGVLHDLTETYRWLNFYAKASSLEPDVLLNYHDERLFLNVKDPVLDPWEWFSADQMFFSDSPDDRGDSFAPVRGFLRQFKSLLVIAGVPSITGPIIEEAPPETLSTDELANVFANFENLWGENSLIDVVFVTNEGEKTFAHRLVLAAYSDHFRSLFTGPFAESRPTSDEHPMVKVMVDYSAERIRYVLEFIYRQKLPESDQYSVLLDVMQLADQWGLSRLFKEIQPKVAAKIKISTHEEILSRSEAVNADMVVKACEEWLNVNRNTIKRLKSG